MSPYRTWYEFKRDLEGQLGRWLPNADWLEARPREPLPWDEASLRAAVGKVGLIRARRAAERELAGARG